MNGLLVQRSDDNNRVIQGQLLAFDSNNGRWSLDGKPPPAGLKLLVAGIVAVAQRWHGGRTVETIWPEDVPSLADAVEEGNESIDQSEWERGTDGKLKAPWAISHVVYLVDTNSAKKFTVALGTTGQRIAVELLQDQVRTMCLLRGANVLAEVVLGVGSFNTRFGTRKPRPDYIVTNWRSLSKDTAPPLALPEVEEPSSGELFDDSVPY